MSINGNIDPNARLQHYLAAGTEELRSFIDSNVVGGNTRELERIEQYYLNWKFYNGYAYKDFNHTLISFNYVKAFIDKQINFLLGDKGFSWNVVDIYNDQNIDPEVETPIEEYIQYTWRRNNKVLTAHEMLQMGGVCGDVWIMPIWKPVEKFVKIKVLDSRQCFPIYLEGDMDELESFQVRLPLENHPKKYRLKVINYTKDVTEIWYQKTVQIRKSESDIYNPDYSGEDIYEYTATENPLGFIPIVHIKNKPQSDSAYGQSDAHNILRLNKVYNEMSQEMKGIIDYYATPTTVVTGATLKGMKRGLGNVWSGLPPEANVFTLGLDADLSAMINFLDKVKSGMHEISDVPENVLGKLQSISGTSAAALRLTFQPLVQQADMKALTYGEGITQLNEMIVRIAKTYDKKNKRLKGFVYEDSADDSGIRIEPVFAYGFPMDRLQILQEGTLEIQLNIGSRRELMNRLGKNNVPDLMAEIDRDRLEQASVQGEVNELSGLTPPPDPNAGADPNAQ